ncbi:MAG: TraR/DksA C4-type zinc finger protein [Methylococcaceae bacterium]|nr:TraR/DksA C4-type zinc finger protein [Methylococcaceae bacterium]
MEDFKYVRENLIDMLEDLDERLEKITDNVKQLDEHIAKDFEQPITGKDNDESPDSLENEARIEIEKIQQAISRIDKGTYGICLSCGQAIKKERLNNTPFSSQCTHCAKKDDS